MNSTSRREKSEKIDGIEELEPSDTEETDREPRGDTAQNYHTLLHDTFVPVCDILPLVELSRVISVLERLGGFRFDVTLPIEEMISLAFLRNALGEPGELVGGDEADISTFNNTG